MGTSTHLHADGSLPGLEISPQIPQSGYTRWPVIHGRRLTDVVAELPKTRAALAYAEHQHAGQRRAADGEPFILHPVEVGSLLYEAGATDPVVAAGVLHDTIEKTSVTETDIRTRFGREIATLVLAVSEDPKIDGYEERKAMLRDQVAAAGPDAQMIFAADKISKVRELALERRRRSRMSGAGGSRFAPERRLAHYRRCCRMLEERLPQSRLVEQLRTELRRLGGVGPGQAVPAGAGR
jgi:(p)ppGpp synthase/HD superfamily hydrolase